MSGSSLVPLAADLAASFARRVAERDVVHPPEPPSQTPAAIGERVRQWLGATYGVRQARARASLAHLLLHLLAEPEAHTAALQQAAGLGPRMTARHLLWLEQQRLTEWCRRGRTRYHRLSRAGEDVLLPVVTGAGVAEGAAG